jgi:hypothetical protein
MSADPNRTQQARTLSLSKRMNRNQSRRNPFLYHTSLIEEEPIGVNYSTIENAINAQRRQRKAAEERQRRAEEEKYREQLRKFDERLAFEKSKANRAERQRQEQAQAKMAYNRRIRLGIEQPRYSGNNNRRSGKQGGKYKTKRRHCRTK